MPRPKASTHTKPTRERLLEAAEAQLHQGGYLGLSLHDVTKASGIQKPGLYHHFPGGKDELVLAVAERVLARNEMALHQAISSVSDPEAQLREVAKWLLSENRPLDRVLREAVRFMPEGNRERITQRFFTASFRPVQEVVQRGITAGTFRPLDAQFVTQAFFGLLAQLSEVVEAESAENTLENLMNLLRFGLRV